MNELLVRSTLEDRVSSLERLTTVMRQDLNPLVRLTDQLSLMQGILGPVGKITQLTRRLDVVEGQSEEAAAAARQVTSRADEWAGELSRIQDEMQLRLRHLAKAQGDFERTRKELLSSTKRMYDDLQVVQSSVRHLEKTNLLLMMMARGETLPPSMLDNAAQLGPLFTPLSDTAPPPSPPCLPDHRHVAAASTEALAGGPPAPQSPPARAPRLGQPSPGQSFPSASSKTTQPSPPRPRPAPSEVGSSDKAVPPLQHAGGGTESGSRTDCTVVLRPERPWRRRHSPSVASPSPRRTAQPRQSSQSAKGDASPPGPAEHARPASVVTWASTNIDVSCDESGEEDAEKFARMATDSHYFYC